MNKFVSYPTDKLRSYSNLCSLALIVVGVGATIGFAASIFALVRDGAMPLAPLVASALALLAAIPTFRDRQRARQELTSRVIKG